jgi:hypothetical protein
MLTQPKIEMNGLIQIQIRRLRRWIWVDPLQSDRPPKKSSDLCRQAHVVGRVQKERRCSWEQRSGSDWQQPALVELFLARQFCLHPISTFFLTWTVRSVYFSKLPGSLPKSWRPKSFSSMVTIWPRQ